MVTDEYFVISNTDGDTFVAGPLSKDELMKRLNPKNEYYGDVNWLAAIQNSDTNYWNGNVIIKGSIVIPQTKTVIESLTID